MIEVCASFGLQLNLKAKKTEVVPDFRGPGAPDARREWLVDRMGSIPLADGRLSVRCVPRYEHLGAIFQSDGGICAEIHHRVSRALLAFRQVREAYSGKPAPLCDHEASIAGGSDYARVTPWCRELALVDCSTGSSIDRPLHEMGADDRWRWILDSRPVF